MLIDYIKQNYKEGEPILLKNIDAGLDYDNLCQQVKRLVDARQLCRFMDGVYYLPKKTVLGTDYVPSADSVTVAKYIRNGADYFGCYSGNTLANMMGLSEQVPYVKEIVSNNTSATTRRVTIGKFDYIVRKAPVKITKENVSAVMVLEMLKDCGINYAVDEETSTKIRDFIQENKVERNTLDELLPSYPLRTYKAIYEMGVADVLA